MVAQAIESIGADCGSAIKLLDLLTNRYHTGVVQESSSTGLEVELPAASHLHAGQRVRYIVAGDEPLVARQSMQRGFITRVTSLEADRFSVRLALLPETAVA